MSIILVQHYFNSYQLLQIQGMNKSYAQALGIKPKELQDFSKVRKAYKAQMATVLRKRDLRVKLNGAYSEVCAKIFKSSLSSLQLMIISGDLEGLKMVLSKDRKLLNAKVNQYPIVYLAVRSGHYDIVEYLLRSGCSIDFKGYKSTPMHCAAYYGHYNIIPLLLMYGISINIKNQFGSLPIEEAANPEIQQSGRAKIQGNELMISTLTNLFTFFQRAMIAKFYETKMLQR